MSGQIMGQGMADAARISYDGRVGAAKTGVDSAQVNAQMYNRLGSDIGNALTAIGGMYSQFQDKKQGAMALDQAMGMAADEKLISYDTLEKFTQLPWRQKKPVFDLVTATVIPIAANRMKTSDQARIWSQYLNMAPNGDGDFFEW